MRVSISRNIRSPVSGFTSSRIPSQRLFSTSSSLLLEEQQQRKQHVSIAAEPVNGSKPSPYVDNKPNFNEAHLYPKPGTFTPSNLTPSKATGRPVPLNVLLNDYEPIRHKPTHGNVVAELHLRAYEPTDLDFFADFTLRAAFYLKMPCSGVIPLKTRRERWTVIRSPFIHAKSKENFERRTHKRVIRVYDTNPEVIEVWLATLSKHAMPGVGMKANVYTHETIDIAQQLETQQLGKLTPEELQQEAGSINQKAELARKAGIDPRDVSFGNEFNGEVASEVLRLLSDPVFKPLLDQTNKDTTPGAPEHAIKESK